MSIWSFIMLAPSHYVVWINPYQYVSVILYIVCSIHIITLFCCHADNNALFTARPAYMHAFMHIR